MTGVTNFYTPTVSKQFGLLRELVPTASLTGVLVNPNEAAFGSQMKDAETAAGQVGHRLVILKASTRRKWMWPFESLWTKERAQSCLVPIHFL